MKFLDQEGINLGRNSMFVVLLAFALLGFQPAKAAPPAHFFLLGNANQALVPVADVAALLNLNLTWRRQDDLTVLSSTTHRVELRNNSTTTLIDGTPQTMDFPAIRFEGMLFVQPGIFHAPFGLALRYITPPSIRDEAALLLTNTADGKALTLTKADVLHHLTTDFEGDGSLEDVYATRVFHARVWVMHKQQTIWVHSFEDTHTTATYLFGVFACSLRSPRQRELLVWYGPVGAYIGATFLQIYRFQHGTFHSILPEASGFKMIYTGGMGGTLVQRPNPFRPPTFIVYNTIGFRQPRSRFAADWYSWNARLGRYQRTLHRETGRGYSWLTPRGRQAALHVLGAQGIPFDQYCQSCPHFMPDLSDLL